MGIGFLMLMEEKSRVLEKDAAVLIRMLTWREGPEESIKNSDEEVLGGRCIKGKFLQIH